MRIGPAATKRATIITSGRVMRGLTRASRFGTALCFQKKQKVLAQRTARTALRPSVAPKKAALATARTSIGPVVTRLAIITTCGRMVPGPTRASTFGIARYSLLRIRLETMVRGMRPQTRVRGMGQWETSCGRDE